MYKIKRIAALSLALILVLGCFNIPPQMGAQAMEDINEGTRVYAVCNEQFLRPGYLYDVSVVADTDIPSLTGFNISLSFNSGMFSVPTPLKDYVTIPDNLLAKNPVTTSKLNTGSVDVTYKPTTAVDIKKNQVLFTVTVRVASGVEATSNVSFGLAGSVTAIRDVPETVTDPDSGDTTQVITSKEVNLETKFYSGSASVAGKFTPHAEISASGNTFPQIGTTLRATVWGVVKDGDGNDVNKPLTDFPGLVLSYRWYRRNPMTLLKTYISGATTDTYTLALADVGYVVGVDIQPGGSYTGTATPFEHQDITVTKKEQKERPDRNSIIVTQVADTWIVLDDRYNYYDFAITTTDNPPSSGAWGKSNVFDRLTPETTYYIWSRYSETTDTKAGSHYPDINYPEDPKDPSGPREQPFAVTTTKVSHQLVLERSGDDTLNPSKVYYTVPDGKLTSGSVVTLFAEPTEGYYFDFWTCSADGVAITNPTTASGATFKMPDVDNKISIVVTAHFQKKKEPSIYINPTSSIEYGVPITKPHEFFNIRLLDAADTGKAVDEQVLIYYKLSGTLGSGMPLPKDAVLNAGKYDIIAVFEEDEKNMSARNDTAVLEVTRSPGVIKDPDDKPVIKAIGEDYITIENINNAQMYLIYPWNMSIPGTGLSIWKPGTDKDENGTMTWTGLKPASRYQVHTYLSESANYTISKVLTYDVSTRHNWKVSVHEGTTADKLCNDLYFYRDSTNDTDPPNKDVPESKWITVRNGSNGKITGADVKLAGNDSDKFTITEYRHNNASLGLGVDAKDVVLEPGDILSFEVVPDETAGDGQYNAEIVINAQQNETTGFEDLNSSDQTRPIEGLPKTILLYYDVSGTPPVSIKNVEDVTVVYDGKEHPIDKEKITASSKNGIFDKNDLAFHYKSTDGGGHDSEDAPVDAGRYLVTVKPKDLQAYVGHESAVITIEKRELTIEGLTVASKLYDGTDSAVLSGGVLKGVVDGESIVLDGSPEMGMVGGMPTQGRFDTKHHGTGKTVSLGTSISATIYPVSGPGSSDPNNYSLTRPTLTGNIQAKPVVPIFEKQIKSYDGTYDLGVMKADIEGLCTGDDISVEITGSKTKSKNAGENIEIVMGTVVVAGNTHGDYVISNPQTMPTATILKRNVIVEVTGEAEVDYDGTPKSLTATYETYADDLPNVSVTYNGVDAAPWLAGRYLIGAIIHDSNYVIQGDVVGIKEMVINAGKLFHTDITRSIIPKDVSLKTIPLSSFNVTTSAGLTNIGGKYSISSVIDANGILESGYPKLENNMVTFKVKSSALLDQYAQIQLVFTPDSGTYQTIEMYLKITMAPEGYINSIINAPTSVNIGDNIDLTNIRLRTVFDSDGRTEDAIVTEAMISGYNKNNLNASNLGQKTIVVTFPGNPLRTASFNIMVLDVLEAFTIRPPDKLEYSWLIDQSLDLTGGLLMPTMRTGSAADAVPLQPGMLNVSNSTLLRIGTYSVTVSYQKRVRTGAFNLRVMEPQPINANEFPFGNYPGIIDYDPNATYKDSAGKTVPFENLQLVITPLSSMNEQKLLDAIKEDGFFKRLPTDSMLVLEVSLRDKTTGLDVEPSAPITFRLTYPSGTDRSTTLRVLHVQRNNEWEVYPPTRREEGIEVTVQNFSPFAIGWMIGQYLEPEDPTDPSITPTPTPTPGVTPSPAPVVTVTVTPPQETTTATGSPSPTPTTTPGVFVYDSLTESEIAFWEAVLDMIKSAEKGSVIRVNAKSYDKMPVEIMEAMVNSSDATLVISWNNGEDIVITSKTAFKPESTREYFPLSLLADLYGTEPPKTDDPEEGEEWLNDQRASASASTSSGSTSNLPTVADNSAFREAMSDYLAQAIMNSNGNVYDITAPDDPERDLMPVTPQTSGWLTSEGESLLSDGIVKPSLEAPAVNSPGIGALLIIIGVILALAGAATGLYIFMSRKAASEEE